MRKHRKNALPVFYRADSFSSFAYRALALRVPSLASSFLLGLAQHVLAMQEAYRNKQRQCFIHPPGAVVLQKRPARGLGIPAKG